MVKSIQFLVQGSSDNQYEVRFDFDGSNLNAYCSCPAGMNGQYCKHRLAILAGESEKIISENAADVSVVQSWLPGTDIELAIHDLAEAEHEFDLTKKKLALAKKALARAMFR
jgi:SWIM zinc finger